MLLSFTCFIHFKNKLKRNGTVVMLKELFPPPNQYDYYSLQDQCINMFIRFSNFDFC